MTVKCPICGSTDYQTAGLMGSTMVGYFRGYINGVYHDHDDNCKTTPMLCSNGHEFGIRKQNFCPACDWVGKTSCFCDGNNMVYILKEDQCVQSAQ